MKSIVVPVNFSVGCSNAARYAADLALAIQGELHLIHVLQMPFTYAEMPMPDTVFDDLRESAINKLDNLAVELIRRTAGKVKVDTLLETGGVEYRIEKFCRKQEPFMVVMGAEGPLLGRMMGGTHTVTALHSLPYPLLVIPETAGFHQIKKIVLACDLEDIGSGIGVAPSFLRELRDLFDASFDVINVSTKNEEGQGQAIFEFDCWNRRLQAIYPELHFVHSAKISEGIVQYLEHHPADWLMVFPKKHSVPVLHSSQAKKIVLHSPVPVMSIHE
jgi:nucleotide-binding universal stress UspA family protein